MRRGRCGVFQTIFSVRDVPFELSLIACGSSLVSTGHVYVAVPDNWRGDNVRCEAAGFPNDLTCSGVISSGFIGASDDCLGLAVDFDDGVVKSSARRSAPDFLACRFSRAMR